jgi:hypothetical protein
LTRYQGYRRPAARAIVEVGRRNSSDVQALSREISRPAFVQRGLLVVILALSAWWVGALPGLAAPAGEIAPGCVNLIENGGFEVVSPHWQIQPGPRPPMYTTEVTFGDSAQSMRVGNGVELPNVDSISEVRYIPVPLPRHATSIILRFRYQPRFDANPSNDLQQADLYYYQSDQLALSLLNVQENDFSWRLVERDLTAFRGQVISLRFRVHNDGLLGRTWMYIDDVELETCSLTPIAPTATPTSVELPTATPIIAPPTPTPPTPTPPTPTPSETPWPASPTAPPEPASSTASPIWPATVQTGTPLPAWPTPVMTGPAPTFAPTGPATPWPTLPPPPPGCVNFIANGGFERFSAWEMGESPIPPRYTSETARSGARSMLLGSVPGTGGSGESYSSIRQLVNLPRSASLVQLRWWQAAFSQEPPLPGAGRIDDRQEVILLTPNLNVMEVLTRFRSTDGVWQQRTLDLTAFRGRSFFVYFNVFNNADPARTWMYLDDVELFVCGAEPIPYEQPAAPFGLPDAPDDLEQEDQEFYPPPVLPTFPPTDTPMPSPTPPLPTATPAPAIATPLPPTATVAPPTATLAPTATEPGAAVAILTTPTSAIGEGTPQIRVPVPAPVVSQPAPEPWWQRMLGALSILCSIPVLIALIIFLLIQIGRLRRAAARQNP